MEITVFAETRERRCLVLPAMASRTESAGEELSDADLDGVDGGVIRRNYTKDELAEAENDPHMKNNPGG